MGAAADLTLRQRIHWDRQTDDSRGKNKMHSSVACERRFCTRRVYTHLPTTATRIVGDVYSAACPDTYVHVTPPTADIQTLRWRQHLHWILTYSPTPVTKLHKHLHINILKIWPNEHAKLTSYFFYILVFFCDFFIRSVIYDYNPNLLTEVFFYPDWGFPRFFLSCKANARVKPAKTGHGPHSSKTFVLFYVLFVLCRSVYCVFM